MALVIYDDQFFVPRVHTWLIDQMPETDEDFEKLVCAVNSYVEKVYKGLYSYKGYSEPLTIWSLKRLFEDSILQYEDKHNQYNIYLSYQDTVPRSSEIIRD